MRTSLLLTLALSATLWAQDAGKRVVESPIKKNLGPAPEKFDLVRTGLSWTEGLDSALNKGKPVLLFQLLGKFDDVYC
jgi:hypothetical protein